MSDGTLARSYGKVFNEVAVEYDRNRPAYPDALVDQACEVARIGDGDRVLEVGCGTGQLTRSLLARGLRVTALEPGEQLIASRRGEPERRGRCGARPRAARGHALPRERYAAVFSASAIHWVDPDVGWRKIADALAPNGTLALIQYFGLKEQRSVDDQEALLSVMRRHAREIAATWPAYRDLDSTIAGVRERRGNIADAWSWLGSHDIGRDYAADLFEDLQLATVPTLVEHTADELNALLATMSLWARLSPDQRDAARKRESGSPRAPGAADPGEHRRRTPHGATQCRRARLSRRGSRALACRDRCWRRWTVARAAPATGSCAFRRRSSSPSSTPNSRWRQVDWAKARGLESSVGSSLRAGCSRSVTAVSGQVRRFSALAATGPRAHEGSGRRGAMFA